MVADEGAGEAQPGWDERCSNELYLLALRTLTWSMPTVRGTPPIPRGGHSAVVVGDHVLILGGCDGGENNVDDNERFVERDLADVRALDTESWEYIDVQPDGVALPPRSGHTAHLLPCDGGVALLVLGGRDYRPPVHAWQEGEHHGRDDAYLLLLSVSRGHRLQTSRPKTSPLRRASPSRLR